MGYGSFWMHGAEILDGKQENSETTLENGDSKDILTGAIVAHGAMNSLAYQPRQWLVFHSYGSL